MPLNLIQQLLKVRVWVGIVHRIALTWIVSTIHRFQRFCNHYGLIDTRITTKMNRCLFFISAALVQHFWFYRLTHALPYFRHANSRCKRWNPNLLRIISVRRDRISGTYQVDVPRWGMSFDQVNQIADNIDEAQRTLVVVSSHLSAATELIILLIKYRYSETRKY